MTNTLSKAGLGHAADQSPLDVTLAGFLMSAGLIGHSVHVATALTGGVASDIWKVETQDNIFVVKRALSQLRVSQVWNAPVGRNASEVDWMEAVAEIAPGAVPRILAQDRQAGVFAMSYFDPKLFPVWKDELREGRVDARFAAEVGRTVGRIQAATAGDSAVAERFRNDETFNSIRVEPYLTATATIHSDLAEPLLSIARDTLACHQALVHGDVSPKNILVGADGPVFLDAECAWYGDPAFDIAFCLSHLLLKCLWRPRYRDSYLAGFDALSAAYLDEVRWEPVADLERRAAHLLPALLLARVDGKSPVEYLEDADKDLVRRFARRLVGSPCPLLAELKVKWSKELYA